MKKSAKIYSWIILSIFVQIVILFYFNNFYFKNGIDITSTNIDVVDTPKEDKSITIPQGATDIKVSYDGTFVSYYLNDNIVVYDAVNKKQLKTLSAPQNKEFTFYKWLPDKNMVIYAVCPKDNMSGELKIFTYDFDIQEDPLRDYTGITTLPRGSRIESVELSPQTNVVYIKIKTSSTKASVFKFDVMNNQSYVMTTDISTVIKQANYVEKIVYQDSKGKVFIREGGTGKTKQLSLKNKAALLSIDLEDKVYVGELSNNGLVEKVYYGGIGTEFKNWDSISLKKPVKPEDIFVTGNGAVYEVDEASNTMYAITNSKDIKYKGKLITVLNDYIVSLDGDKLKLEAFDTDSIKN